jgi:hypothetical protein
MAEWRNGTPMGGISNGDCAVGRALEAATPVVLLSAWKRLLDLKAVSRLNRSKGGSAPNGFPAWHRKDRRAGL